MGGHGQGDVAVPAGVAADVVVVRAALLLRGLEAPIDRPPSTGDTDRFIERGVSATVDEVGGDLVGPSDVAAGDHPMPPVFAVPGTDLRPGPVEDAGSAEASAAGPGLPQ